MSKLKNIPIEKKVDIILNYLFDDDKAVKEEFFWNQLKKREINELKKIQKEKTILFKNLKK